ncbi:MAG TPA: hypothetical protein PKH07_20010, partial [bacterium]|nr:hypothetical protein [bacterium]
GFLGVAGFLWTCLGSIWPLYRKPDQFGELGALGRSLFVGLVAMLGTGLTYQAFQWGTLITPLLVLSGCGLVLRRISQEEPFTKPSPEEAIQEVQ